MATGTSNERATMTTSERRDAMAATLPQGDCDCHSCLDTLIAKADDTTVRKLITVPRGPHATVQAIDESGLINIQSTGITACTGLTNTYAIIGYELTDRMSLTIELSHTEYVATMKVLRNATGDARWAAKGLPSLSTPDVLHVQALELGHLHTLLAEASQKATT